MNEEQKGRREAANRRTAWILATIALAFLLGIFLKKLLIG